MFKLKLILGLILFCFCIESWAISGNDAYNTYFLSHLTSLNKSSYPSNQKEKFLAECRHRCGDSKVQCQNKEDSPKACTAADKTCQSTWCVWP